MIRTSMLRAAVVAGAMTILAFAAIATASAAPAEPDSYRNCVDDQWMGQQGTTCFTIHSVDKYSTNEKSGRTLTHESGTMLIEFVDANGNLGFSDKTQWHTTIIEKDGAWHVYHDKVRVSGYLFGEYCTAEMNVVFANGEVRHLGPAWEWDCR